MVGLRCFWPRGLWPYLRSRSGIYEVCRELFREGNLPMKGDYYE